MKKEMESEQQNLSWLLEDNGESGNSSNREKEEEKAERLGIERVLKAVRDGDITFFHHMKDREDAAFMRKPNDVAGSGLRKAKDECIVNLAILAFTAEEGGMARETAERMRDTFILRLEDVDSMSGIMAVMWESLQDFIQSVYDTRHKENGLSPQIRKVCDYIRQHAGEGNLSLSEIAGEVGYTEYYLTKKFYRETGSRLSDYIKKEKIDLACVWLVATDRSIEEISDVLGFGNRGYFSRVFKEITGTTPKEYRLHVVRTGAKKETTIFFRFSGSTGRMRRRFGSTCM